MWSFASNAIAGSVGSKNCLPTSTQNWAYCSDDEISNSASREEGLDCPICWESFNMVENAPYVLWCGHTICKNCVLGLQWVVVKFPSLPVQLPLFISCPWRNLLPFRLMYKGNLKFPRKNFFLLWMVENMNGDRFQSRAPYATNHQLNYASNRMLPSGSRANHNVDHGRFSFEHSGDSQQSLGRFAAIREHLSMSKIRTSLQKSLVYFFLVTSKFPLVVLLLIILYAIPASCSHLRTIFYCYCTVCSSVISDTLLCVSKYG